MSDEYGASPATDPDGASAAAAEGLRDRVIGVLKTCYDPEIPVDIYEVAVDEAARSVAISMTLTSPMCPVAEILPPEVESKVRAMEGVERATVEVTWEPPWNPGMMSEAARLELNM